MGEAECSPSPSAKGPADNVHLASAQRKLRKSRKGECVRHCWVWDCTTSSVCTHICTRLCGMRCLVRDAQHWYGMHYIGMGLPEILPASFGIGGCGNARAPNAYGSKPMSDLYINYELRFRMFGFRLSGRFRIVCAIHFEFEVHTTFDYPECCAGLLRICGSETSPTNRSHSTSIITPHIVQYGC